ncbi:MAG TPA: multiheme c-type cytochrome [Candidatus Binatia bacterium]
MVTALPAIAIACLWIGIRAARADEPATAPRFHGDTTCGKAACHGGPVPEHISHTGCRDTPDSWKWAWTQWRNRRVDHHSRAYETLTRPESQTIGRYMGIVPTQSDKCLQCHAPAAVAMPAGNWQRKDGVTCEDCHGGSEFWLEAHSQKDWKEKKAEYAKSKGFYNNSDFRLRAEKCGQCHVEIDHEIVAGGHPPLQFEMVAYAQLMKHWNDSKDRENSPDCADPSLWSIGQLVGLRRAAEMVARRAADSDYQSIGKFPHFEDRDCYSCHHKLVADGIRQVAGHFAMSDVILSVLLPGEKGALAAAWSQLQSSADSDRKLAAQRAGELGAMAADYSRRIAAKSVTRADAQALLKRITASGATLKAVRRFSHSSSPSSNVESESEPSLPWWYTTGAPEQTVLSIEALCNPAFDSIGIDRCSGSQGIEPELRRLGEATDRFHYDPEQFAKSLGDIHHKLFPGSE